MGLARAEVLVRSRALGQVAQEVGQGRRHGEEALPFQAVLGQPSRVAVGGDDVDVTSMERRYGNRTAPVDEVLSVFADLTEGENVALCDLVEAAWTVRCYNFQGEPVEGARRTE